MEKLILLPVSCLAGLQLKYESRTAFVINILRKMFKTMNRSEEDDV